MKKLLLASTALVAFAGAASAEVALSGYAEMGIRGGDDIETQFHNDVSITFKMSGTTDGGLEFGATVDYDDTNGGGLVNGASTMDSESAYISGSFGKITLGETDGAFDWALTEIYMGTSLADDHSTHAGAYWNTGLDGTYDDQIARYEYSFGDFAAAISAELDDAGVGDANMGLGIKWSGDMNGTAVGVGLGYQSNGTNDVIGVSANATLANGLSLNIGYADLDGIVTHGGGVTSDNWMGLGVGYTSGALLVQANYGVYDTNTALGDVDGFGLVANYDLGGGAVVMAGYGSGDVGSFNGAGEDTFSLGLGLSF